MIFVRLFGTAQKAPGVPRSCETPTPQDPTVGLCLRHYGDPKGVSVSYERGTPVKGTRLPGYPGKGRDFPVQTEETDPIPAACRLLSGGSSREPGINTGPVQIGPLSSESGTYTTVKAGFWPWLSRKVTKPFLSSCHFARKRSVLIPNAGVSLILAFRITLRH